MNQILGQYGMFIMIILFIAVIYFLMIRPARRQQQKQQQMMDSLRVGTRVMLTSGIYGTIRHMGDNQAIIEISPGVDLTVLRRAIAKATTPDEEEFEYADASAEAGDETDPTEPDETDAAPASDTPTSGTGWSLADLPADDPAAPPPDKADSEGTRPTTQP